MKKTHSRRIFRDGFAQNNLFCENNNQPQRPYTDEEKPYENLNKYQKRLILFICRQFSPDGWDKLCEELSKLQYCSLETALRVAQEGGYLPQDTLNDMEELKMAQSLMSDEAMIEMIGLYMQRAKPSELAEKYNLDVKQVSNLIYRAKSDDKYKHLFTTIQAPVPSENDIDRAANAIDNYLTEKELTGDITEIEAQQEVTISAPTVFKATAEGLIEAVNGQVFVDNYNLIRAISEQLADNFVGNFYGRVEICFKILDRRDVFEFEIK